MAISLAGALFASGVMLIIYILNRVLNSKRHHLPLPPGPKGLPLLGNVNDLPKPGELEAHHWTELKDQYGPICSLTIMGQTLIVINDADLTMELLRDRATINSERADFTFVGSLVGWNDALAMLGYTDTFRAYRRNIAKTVSSKIALASFDRVQEEEAGHLLLNLLNSPADFAKHLHKQAGSVMFRILYGYAPVAHGQDPLIDQMKGTITDFSEGTVPGKFMVDMIPMLRYVPDWFPGAGFKTQARIMEDRLYRTVEDPYQFVKKQMRENKHRISFMSQAIEDIEENSLGADAEHIYKWSGLSMNSGGADTTVSGLLSFFLAMTLFPEVQKHAREEIDRVVGSARLPVSVDRPNLPYIDAVLKETLRWHPVVPLAIPHVSKEEQEIRGYRIPKGAMLIPNTWWFTHDPTVYPDPMVFRPERYLKNESPAPNPAQWAFGYGRRVCPGKQIADNALFLTLAQTLAVFDISKPIENGKPVEPAVKFEPGVISAPLPFKATIRPRSEAHRRLIESVENKFPWLESDAKELEDLPIRK